MNVCVNCKHCNTTSLGCPYPTTYTCHHPESVDIISGQPRSCEEMRKVACGYSGVLFEQKPEPRPEPEKAAGWLGRLFGRKS
jgi:hypothetical protein